MPFVNAYVTDTSNGELLKKAKNITFAFKECSGSGSGFTKDVSETGFYQIRVSKIPDCLFFTALISDTKGKQEYLIEKLKDGVKDKDGNLTFKFNFTGIGLFTLEASSILEQSIQKSTTGTNTTTNQPSENKSVVDISGKKPSKNKWIYIGLGILLVGGLVYYFKKRK